MNAIIKIIKSLEDSNLLIDGITETVKHIIKNRKDQFCPALLAPLTNLLMQSVISNKRYKSKRNGVFNGVFLRINLTKIKDGAYVINIDDKKVKEQRNTLGFISIDTNTAGYFYFFGVECIPQEY